MYEDLGELPGGDPDGMVMTLAFVAFARKAWSPGAPEKKFVESSEVSVTLRKYQEDVFDNLDDYY